MVAIGNFGGFDFYPHPKYPPPLPYLLGLRDCVGKALNAQDLVVSPVKINRVCQKFLF